MPEPHVPPATQEDLRLLAVELSDQSLELGADLAVELRELAATLAREARADVDHLADLALGELRIARRETVARSARSDELGEHARAKFEARLTALIVVGNTAVVLATAILVAVLA